MGYRSEVAVAVKTADYEKFIKGNSDFKNLMSIADISTNDEIVIMYWDWVKWYPEYEDIQKFESVLFSVPHLGHILLVLANAPVTVLDILSPTAPLMLLIIPNPTPKLVY